jgi:UPF0716 protein FxsA
VLWIVLALVLMPIAELWLIIQIAQVIGGWETLALLVIEALLGGWLMKRQGRSVIRRIDERLRAHDLPTKELADGFLIMVAGVLMLTPGFITDVVGFLLLLPPTRAIARAALLRRFTAKMGEGFGFVTLSGSGFPSSSRRGGGFMDTTATETPRRPPAATPLGPGTKE